MAETETTRVSSRGQVVIPQAVRDAVQLREGELFAVYGEGDTIVMKRVTTPKIAELKAILAEGHAFARRKKLTRRDVEPIISHPSSIRPPHRQRDDWSGQAAVKKGGYSL